MKTNVNLTANEKAILVALAENAKNGDTGVEYVIAEVAQAVEKGVASVAMTARSLEKKGLVVNNAEGCYFDGCISPAGKTVVNDLTGEEKTGEVEETGKDEKVENTTTTRRSKKEVGDIHPNGRWIWREYRPGKFDWRTITPEEKEVWDSIRTVDDDDVWIGEIEKKFGEEVAKSLYTDEDINYRMMYRYAIRLSKKVCQQAIAKVGCNPEE